MRLHGRVCSFVSGGLLKRKTLFKIVFVQTLVKKGSVTSGGTK